jgi:adenylate cyclase
MGLLSKHWSADRGHLIPLVFALLHAIGALPIGVLQRLDDIIYDARLRATMPRRWTTASSSSTSTRRAWPSRPLALGPQPAGRMVDELFDRQKVAIVGFDVVFAEPDDSSGLKRLRSWPQAN